MIVLAVWKRHADASIQLIFFLSPLAVERNVQSRLKIQTKISASCWRPSFASGWWNDSFVAV